MKNIHLIPTTKEQHAIIQKNTGLLLVQTRDKVYTGTKLNIYITSDEEIKEGDWVLGGLGGVDIKKYGRYFADDWKKIILTTDQNLIKDGVQAIDDEFLEWFVKNPSCEEVKIESWQTKGEWDLDYKIIIPREEPTTFLSFDKEVADTITREGQALIRELQKQVEQETVEEAAKKLAEDEGYDTILGVGHIWIEGFEKGAQWQQEQDKNKYSEDALIILLNKFGSSVYGNYTRNQTMEDFTIEWFEQNKKK
jgi:hypothetical protein